MRHSIAILGLALLPALPQPARAAATPPDSVATGLVDATCPVAALDPRTHAAHIAYIDNGTLHHAWQAGGDWLDESVASASWNSSVPFDGADIRVAFPGGVVWVLYRDPTNLVCARRVGGTWFADPLDAATGIAAASLAISPVTGEPVVAWGKRQGGQGTPVDFKLARRSGGVWTTQLLDTSSTSQTRVAVAVDLADRPRVAYSRPRGDAVAARVLTCAMATGPTGPFVSSTVDSQLTGYVSLALDPASGDPRVAYGTVFSVKPQIRYAAWDGGGWQVVQVVYRGDGASLVIDAAGNPFISLTEYTPISPQDIRAGDLPEQQFCFYVETGDVGLYYRAGGTGFGAFQGYQGIRPPYHDVLNGPRALVTYEANSVGVAFRSPGQVCAPYDIAFARSTPLADVPPRVGSPAMLHALAPNPLRAGEPLRVRFALANAADVELDLHDAAGRSVARQAWSGVDAGDRSLEWALPLARPGLYWLSARADGVKIGSRAVVVVR
jgi:hypothetical protein